MNMVGEDENDNEDEDEDEDEGLYNYKYSQDYDQDHVQDHVRDHVQDHVQDENRDHLRQLAFSNSGINDGNRLSVHKGGNSNNSNGNSNNSDPTAHCELVGLLPIVPFTSFSYEIALAMQLAIQHLNQGDGTLVQEVEGLDKTCPITFSASFLDTTLNPNNAFAAVDQLTRVIADTDSNTNTDANTNTNTNTNTNALPCAFVGAIGSSISKPTALVTSLRGFPQLSPASTSTDLSEKSEYPLFGRTIPDDGFAAKALLRFLHDTIGIRHVFCIFESDPFPRSILKSFHDAIRELGWAPSNENKNENEQAFYMEQRLVDSGPNSDDWSSYDDGNMREAFEALQASDFRFVIALTKNRHMNNQLMKIAHEEGVAGTGTYQWLFVETLSGLDRFDFPENLAQAYNGTGYIYQTTERDGDTYAEYSNQSRQLKTQLYQEHAASGSNTSEWMFGTTFLNESEWFQNGYIFDYSAYTYDATILLGLSACLGVATAQNETSLFLSGKDYFKNIQDTNFTGITGEIQLDPNTGTRKGDSVKYAIDNWLSYKLHNEDNSSLYKFRSTTSYVHTAGGHEGWDEVGPYVFNGGKTLEELGSDPGLPPVQVMPIVVSKSIQGLALGLLAIILLATTGFVIWTSKYWSSRVVRASQPKFLLLLCFGIAILALSIVPYSLEHSELLLRISLEQASITCYSIVYLVTIGFGITFSALFAKMYRINKIISSSIKCRRVQISFKETLYPVVIMSLFNIIMLSLMTEFGPIVYEFEPIEYDRFGRHTQEYGACNFDAAYPFIYTLVAVNVGMVCLAIFQAWRARNLSTEFAESKHIASALSISCIVAILALPVTNLTQMNPDADTFVSTILVSVISGFTLCSIFVPKIIFHINATKRESNRTSRFSILARLSSRMSSLTIPSFSHSPSVRTKSSDTSINSGERILTTKPQEELVSENKSLKKKLIAMEKQMVALQQRIEELSGDGAEKEKVDDPYNLIGSNKMTEFREVSKMTDSDSDDDDVDVDVDVDGNLDESTRTDPVPESIPEKRPSRIGKLFRIPSKKRSDRGAIGGEENDGS